MAIRQFCQEGHLKWVSLMWAGADPRSIGPTLHDTELEGFTSVMNDACWAGNAAVLKLGLDPKRDDVTRPPKRSPRICWSSARAPTDKPNGGSTVLEGLILRLQWEDTRGRLYGGPS